MSATHNDLRRLIEYSIENSFDSAVEVFNMFREGQIRSLYDITITKRLDLLTEWGGDGDPLLDHCLKQFHDPHDPAQAEKLRQLEADPSN